MAPSSRPDRIWPVLLIILILIVAGIVVWNSAPRAPVLLPPAEFVREMSDPAVLQANNHGIGHMEQFDYWKAVPAFEEAVRRAPDWLPGQINLALALLNTDDAGSLARAVEIFTRILQHDPDNPYAHFGLGIILRHQTKIEEAIPHFEAVTRIDPRDAAAWYWLGSLLPEDREARAVQCFERAHELNPYLRGPIYALAMKYRERDPKKADALLEEMKKLDEATWISVLDVKYTEMGRYGDVIGRVPPAAPPSAGPLPLFMKDDKFQVSLASNARWAQAGDFQGTPETAFQARLRDRFGGTLVVLDFNRDDKADLFLLGAIVENGQVRDLLLRGDGDGRFTDITASAGLGGPRVSFGCAVADFDNDGYPDLLLTGADGVRLFRNNRNERFDDVTRQAGLNRLHDVCLGAAWVDLDQDGDLDLVIAPYAGRAGLAAALPSAPLAVFLNVGEAPPAQPDRNPPPLTPAFTPLDGVLPGLEKPAPFVNLLVSDLDLDRDLDLLVVADRQPLSAILNDRLLKFQHQVVPVELVPAGTWNGGLVLDANHDGIFDLLLVGPGQRPLLLLGQPVEGEHALARCFRPEATNAPRLLQAQASDLDLDGFTDVIGLTEQRRPALLHNDGSRLVHAAEALGRDADWPRDLLAVRAAILDGDTFPSLLVWSARDGLQRRASQGNRHHGLRVQPVGQRRIDKHKMRTNADGIGTAVTVQTRNRWTSIENTTLEAGLGQSRQPLLFGLGEPSQADIIRLRWPDNTWQAEFGQPTTQVLRIEESNRKPTSCPILFAWDGRRFGFITDFLGAGSMGERQPDGSCRPPRPEESIKIEPHQLRPRAGKYLLKLAEPMDEVTYLDRLQLVVHDHPAGVRVYPDERLATADPPPSQELFAFREEIFPDRVRDHRGRDLTDTLRRWDRLTADGFARRSWLGLAEEHAVELDFGGRLARFGPQDRLVLFLAGWTDYAYPESLWAAAQAGVAVVPPVLERRRDDGRWEKLADAGFPAGLPRMMTLELTGQLSGPRCVLRLRTNLEVFWDQIFVAPLLEGKAVGEVRSYCRDVSAATLSARGCMQEYSPDGREPTLYDYDRLVPTPLTRLQGTLTRHGEVAELLLQRDDRFVIFGPGDELSVEFDARGLPDLPWGWTRSFVLRTWGYCKDSGPFTATGDTIEPLPFAGMKRYPYGPEECYPRDDVHREYLRRYQTRAAR
jgi:tetratricopeptide (TPR) repeat protein